MLRRRRVSRNAGPFPGEMHFPRKSLWIVLLIGENLSQLNGTESSLTGYLSTCRLRAGTLRKVSFFPGLFFTRRRPRPPRSVCFSFSGEHVMIKPERSVFGECRNRNNGRRPRVTQPSGPGRPFAVFRDSAEDVNSEDGFAVENFVFVYRALIRVTFDYSIPASCGFPARDRHSPRFRCPICTTSTGNVLHVAACPQSSKGVNGRSCNIISVYLFQTLWPFLRPRPQRRLRTRPKFSS